MTYFLRKSEKYFLNGIVTRVLIELSGQKKIIFGYQQLYLHFFVANKDFWLIQSYVVFASGQLFGE
ncbi:MAG TPA: hypothetical protein VF273_09710 [Pelobium sp.]